MSTNFKFTTNYFVNNLTCQLFIQKKRGILVKIYNSITNKDRDCPFTFCSTSKQHIDIMNTIDMGVKLYNQININHHNNIIEILLDEN